MKLFKPYISPKAIENVMRVLQTDQLAEGPEVKAFEAEFGSKFPLTVGAPIAVNSGTAALELAYELAGIEEGDEVITPILTCTATNLPLIHRKAKIVFADITNELNLDIEDVKRKITPKTRAIVFVHFGGNNKGLSELLQIGEQTGIKIIEDAAQAVGSEFWGQADFTAVSLQAIKTLTSGDGGFLICKDYEDFAKAKRLRWFGYDRDLKQQLGDTDLLEAGYKYHMNDISAAIGRGNLDDIDMVTQHRKMIGHIYETYGLFAHMWLAGGFTHQYEQLHLALATEGIDMGQHHYRNDKYTVFGGRIDACPNMDFLESKYFFVPLHMGVTREDAHKIGQICKNFII